MQHGFDLTDFGSAENFKAVLAALELPEIASRTGDKVNAFVFKNDQIEIVTGNNPITGEYRGTDRPHEIGYASYIGIEGDAAAVRKAISAIEKHSTYIKGWSYGCRAFI